MGAVGERERKDEWRTGGVQNDLHMTPNPEKERDQKEKGETERIAFPHSFARKPFINYSLPTLHILPPSLSIYLSIYLSLYISILSLHIIL